ncbi:hypothetical protein JW964_05290 [candidate division KSB1 bacterium]|nr:hypothetical protein [candidate division KSB1 bacterium]
MNKIKFKNFILLAALTLIANSFSFSDEERLRGEADLVEIKNINNQFVRKLTGNVRFIQGDSRLFCEEATWYESEQKVILERNVVIDDAQKVLSADYVVYFEALQREEARGNVKIVDSSRTLTAERVIYLENEEKAIAENKVKIVDEERRVTLLGGYAEYFQTNDSILVTFSPVFIQHDSLGKEEIRITGQVMELTQNGQVAIVTDSVHITRDSTEASCGLAEFWRESNQIILRINPRIWQADMEITGDSILMAMKDDQIEKAFIINHAVIFSKSDSIDSQIRWDKLTGKLMTIYFKDNTIDQVIVENQATSWYHLIEETRYKGLNKVTGDKISLHVSNNALKRIQIESKPGSSIGVFYPAEKPIPATELQELNFTGRN